MKGRLLVIVLALAALAFVGLHHGERTASPQGDSNAASGQLAAPPAPEPDVPSIVAAVSTAATIQMHSVGQSHRQPRPNASVLAASPHLPAAPHGTGRPRVFPLLI